MASTTPTTITGASTERTWCPCCSRHAVDADGSCTACGAALFLHSDED